MCKRLVEISKIQYVVNYLRFGSLTEFSYGYFASLATHDGWTGLIELLASPGAGLVFLLSNSDLAAVGSVVHV